MLHTFGLGVEQGVAKRVVFTWSNVGAGYFFHNNYRVVKAGGVQGEGVTREP